MVCVVRERGINEKVDAFITNGAALNLLIKIFAMGNAGGGMAPLCCIVAIDQMPPDTFFKSRIKGMSHSMNADAGWLYFCKSRGGCAAMWRDIFLDWLIPTIHASDEYYQDKHEDGTPMCPFLHTDGEANIMNEVFDDEVMAAFNEARVIHIMTYHQSY